SAAFVISHGETVLRQLVFPKFAGIMEENSCEQEIEVQLRIKRRDLRRNPHHLRSVLDQTTATRMMIVACSSCASKAITQVMQKRLAQGPETRIGDGGAGLHN